MRLGRRVARLGGKRVVGLRLRLGLRLKLGHRLGLGLTPRLGLGLRLGLRLRLKLGLRVRHCVAVAPVEKRPSPRMTTTRKPRRRAIQAAGSAPQK